MKALTIWQPWATLLVRTPPGCEGPLKQVETRSWPPPRRALGADVAIHAAMRRPRAADMSALPEAARGIGFPLGCVVGVGGGLHARQVVEHQEWLGITWAVCDDDTGFRMPSDAFMGDWSVGRWLWCWRWTEAWRAPVPVKGRQGLWEWRR